MAESEVPDAQWPVFLDQKCELCEINNISYKCLNCDELICETCMKIHLKSKIAKDHKVVCFQSAEIYENNQTGKKCPSHMKEDLLMYCNTCNCPICRECVTSGAHPNHSMVKVEEVIDIKQKQLSNIIRQTNEKSKKYKDVIKTIAENKLEFSESITKKIKEVKARNNQFKSRLDKMESDYINQLQNIDKENKKAMTELEQRLQGEMSNINELIQQCEWKQRDRNIEMVKFVTDVTQRLDKYRPYDPPGPASPPNLITRPVDDQVLMDLFGYLDIKTANQPLPLARNISLTSPHLDNKTANQPLPQARNISSTSPNIDVKIVHSFTATKKQVVTTDNDQAWLWNWSDRDISLVTSDGKVIQNISTYFDVYDAAVTKSGDLLVTVYRGNKVKKLTGNKTFTDIYTVADGYWTRGITVTDTGNVLVVLCKYNDSKIVEITTSGRHIRTIQHDTVDNKQMFDYPRFICTNINGDIIVTDRGKVVVVTQQGQKRFIYHQGEGRKLKESFGSQNVVTDKHGHIIISDYINSVVHVLDKDGKFLKYLITPEQGCSWPVGMDIDSSGRLWVCNAGNNKILIVKYV